MKSILVADDMAIFREPISAALRKEGYEVRGSSNGVEALASVTAKMPDLILLDLVMPQMDGLTFLKQLREIPQYRNVPVIILTSVAEKDCVLEAMTHRVRDYLLKSSFALTELLRRVRHILNEQDMATKEGATEKAAAEAVEASRQAPPESIDPLTLVGSILFLDDQEAECRLVEHHLKHTRIRLTTITQLGQALDLVKRKPFDIVMIDHDLDGTPGEEAAARIIDDGFIGWIVMMTDGNAGAGSDSGAVEGGTGTGASRARGGGGGSHVSIAKPCAQSTLFALIHDLLAKTAAMMEAEAVTSLMASDPEMTDLIVWYVDRVKTLAHEIRREVDRGSFDEVRKRCQVLKETGGGYGFTALADAASEAVRALDEGKTAAAGRAGGSSAGAAGGGGGSAGDDAGVKGLENAKVELRRLEELCKRLMPMSLGKAKLAGLSASRSRS